MFSACANCGVSDCFLTVVTCWNVCVWVITHITHNLLCVIYCFRGYPKWCHTNKWMMEISWLTQQSFSWFSKIYAEITCSSSSSAYFCRLSSFSVPSRSSLSRWASCLAVLISSLSFCSRFTFSTSTVRCSSWAICSLQTTNTKQQVFWISLGNQASAQYHHQK